MKLETYLERRLHQALRDQVIRYASRGAVAYVAEDGKLKMGDLRGSCHLCLSSWPPDEEVHEEGCLAAPESMLEKER